MCECGCIGNDQKYRLPGPGEAIYLISLSVACENCDAPSGVSIELLQPSSATFKEYTADEMYGVEPLELNDWPDSKGVGIVTGMLKDEFIKAMVPHLVGVDSRKLGENGVLDEVGAEVIVEEMYADSWLQPAIVKQST